MRGALYKRMKGTEHNITAERDNPKLKELKVFCNKVY